MRRLAIKLTKAGERSLRDGHPWIFDKSITKASADAQTGDLAIIYGVKSNKVIGIGLWDQHSPIRIKMLHHDGPTQIDSGWLYTKIHKAYKLRAPLLATDTNSYRLVFGENDGLPSLIIDIYDHVAVIKLYALIWLPMLDDIVESVHDIAGSVTCVLRLSRNAAKHCTTHHDGQVLMGDLPDPVIIFREHGVRFSANVLRGHKTGYFLDHRANRHRVGQLSKEKTVLDVFSYAGGFSVHALAGGASAVTSVDISKPALELSEYNASLNEHTGTHITLAGDAFDIMSSLARQPKQYDILVVDPPSFAKKADEVAKAMMSYRKLTRLAIPLVKPGGILLSASCSSRVKADEFYSLILDELQNAQKRYEIIDKTQHDIDHPIGFPEGAYLKSIYVRLG